MAEKKKVVAQSADIRAEVERRAKLPRAIAECLKALHPKQLAFVSSKSRFKATHSGRRGGKTRGLVIMALKACLDYPGETIVVVEKTLTAQSTKAFWDELIAVNDTYELGIDFRHTHKIATLSNGSTIEMMGADTVDAADKLRGGRYPLAIIDEAGTFRFSVLEFIIDECIIPALMDWGGSIVVSGTPNLQKKGPFYEICHNLDRRQGYDVHNWTLLDNDALPLNMAGATSEERYAARHRELTDELARQGGTWENPTAKFVREYLGQWAENVGDTAFHLTEANIIDTLPVPVDADVWTYYLSCDLGFNDPAASVVWGRRDGDPSLYVLWSEQRPHLTPSRWSVWVEQLKLKYSFSGYVADTGGLGKAYVEQAAEQVGIFFDPAKKHGRLANIEFVNGDLESCRVKILRHTNEDLIQDLYALPLNEDGDDTAEGYMDHLPDAFLYGHGYVAKFAQTNLGKADKPAKGSKEWWAAKEDSIWAKVTESLTKKNRKVQLADY